MKTSKATLLCLALVSLNACCLQRGTVGDCVRTGPPYVYVGRSHVPPSTEWAWCVGALEQVYRRDGISAFLRAKEAFTHHARVRHMEESGYSIACFFLPPDVWAWKESQAADGRDLQELM